MSNVTCCPKEHIQTVDLMVYQLLFLLHLLLTGIEQKGGEQKGEQNIGGGWGRWSSRRESKNEEQKGEQKWRVAQWARVDQQSCSSLLALSSPPSLHSRFSNPWSDRWRSNTDDCLVIAHSLFPDVIYPINIFLLLTAPLLLIWDIYFTTLG